MTTRLLAVALALGVMTIALAVLTGAFARAAGGAGTDIGNAEPVSGTVTGSLASALSDDWYVVYPSVPDGTVVLKVTNTVATAAACTNLYGAADNPDGGAIQGVSLSENTAETYTVSGSSAYYVELDDGGCSGSAVTYSVAVTSGGGGTVPNRSVGTIAAGDSIGTATSPLQGDTIYQGLLASATADAWYVLDKTGDGSTATVRIANTTVKGSTACTNLYGSLDNADGGVIEGISLSENTAVSFPVTMGGKYFIELDDGACASGLTTYLVDPEPGSEWTEGPGTPKPGTIDAGDSIGGVRSPLQGDAIYDGVIADDTVDAWYVLDKADDTTTATVRIANTAVRGSTTCTNLYGSLDDADGNVIEGIALSENTAVSFPVTKGGEYYVALNDGGCPPSGTTGGPTYTIEPEPASEWTRGPSAPALGSTAPASSLATATLPLQGGAIYSAVVPDNTREAWYLLQKTGDGNTGTVRVVNTTVRGSTSCTNLYGALDDADGNAIEGIALSDNTAIGFPVTAGGSYYIELNDGGCAPSGTTGGPAYTIEPEPAAEWSPGASPTTTTTSTSTPTPTTITTATTPIASPPTTPTTTTPTPPLVHPTPTSTLIVLQQIVIVATDGVLKVSVSCGGSRCSGTFRLTVRVKQTVRKGRKTKTRRVTITIGSAAFSGLALGTHSVSLKLNRTGRRLLKADDGRLSTTATVTYTSGGHHFKTTSTKISLRGARPKRTK